MNLSVDFLTRAVLAIVAGGGSYHYSGVNQLTHRAAYRIIPV